MYITLLLDKGFLLFFIVKLVKEIYYIDSESRRQTERGEEW